MIKKGKYLLMEEPPEQKGTVEIHLSPIVRFFFEGRLDRKVKCWVTSPPYYRQRRYTRSDDELGTEETLEEYLSIMKYLAKAFCSATAAGGLFWMVIGDTRNYSGGQGGDYLQEDGSSRLRKWEGARESDPPTALLRVPNKVTECFCSEGWFLLNDICLNKKTSRRSAPRRISDSHERILLFAKDNDYHIYRDNVYQQYSTWTTEQFDLPASQQFKKEVLKSARKRAGAYLRDVWEIAPGVSPSVTINGKLHKAPAAFPELIPEICILLSTKRGELVCDPFCGFGSTLTAAKRWGRDAVGIDIDPTAVIAARKRVEKIE